MRAAVVHLTSEVFNKDGLNVVALATVRGSIPIVEELLNTSNVYRFRERGAILYDVTYLTPHTTPTIFEKRKSTLPVNRTRRRTKKLNTTVGVLESPVAAGKGVFEEAALVAKATLEAGSTVAKSTASTIIGPSTVSCLELIVSIPDEIQASRMLDIAPYRQLVRNTWSGYQWVYIILMIIHIVYMILYTVYAIPNTTTLVSTYNTSSSGCIGFSQTPELFGLFLIWPVIIVIFILYYTISDLVHYCIKNRICAPSRSCKCPTGIQFIELPFMVVSIVFNYLAQLSALAFGALTITWYALYRCGTTSQTYVQVSAAVFIIGWMFTLNFTKGFETMHAFSVMLKYIILRDITRFLVMYVFVLLGFGLAFFALFQISPTQATENGTIWDTMFTMFNLMVGLGSPLDSNFSSTYAAAGGNPTFVYWIYILYIAIASIIMMNLLVAMMSDTFANIKSNEGTTWQVGSLQLALSIERSLPILQKLLQCSGRNSIQYDSVAGRWMLSVPTKDAVGQFGGSADKIESIDAMLKIVQRLETKIDQLQAAHGELAQQVDAVSDTVRGSGAAAASGLAVKKPQTNAFFNAVQMMRARPKSAAKGLGTRRPVPAAPPSPSVGKS
jgi:Ion transport protein